MAHTPTPWKYDGCSINDFGREWDGSLSMEWIANGNEDGMNAHEDEDAAFIIRAVNAFEPMREALNALLKICGPMREEWLNDAAFVDACRDYENAKAALALADKEGE